MYIMILGLYKSAIDLDVTLYGRGGVGIRYLGIYMVRIAYTNVHMFCHPAKAKQLTGSLGACRTTTSKLNINTSLLIQDLTIAKLKKKKKKIGRSHSIKMSTHSYLD